MNTQTMNRNDVYNKIYALSDSAMEKLAPYVDFLSYEDYADMPHVPNAKTAAAIRDARTGNVQRANSIKEFFDAMNEDDD